MRKLFLGVIIFAVFVTAFTYHTFFKKEEILEPEFVLTYAENQSSDYPTTRAAYRFAELVKEETNGKVLIEIKHSGELGSQRDVVDQMQFGGIPVEVPYSDVCAALETGEIDLAENNWASYVSERHYEVAENMFLTEHARVPEIQMMSQRTWEKLPEEYREIILASCKELVRPLYEKYCSEYMDLIEEIQAQN